jgi:hypothetical protein
MHIWICAAQSRKRLGADDCVGVNILLLVVYTDEHLSQDVHCSDSEASCHLQLSRIEPFIRGFSIHADNSAS